MIKLTDTLQETAKLAEIARKCKITRSAVSQWDQVPAKHVLTVENVTGISRHDLRPDIYGPSVAALVNEADTNPPVGSSSGEAGALPPTPHDAPAIFQQDRAVVAQLVHTQQVAGSNPAPATSFQSPEVLPSGDTGARRLSKACRAPNSHGEVA